jgi:plasmid stability protein
MAQILVRNLDERVVRRLKRRAKAAGRSLQAEAKAILEDAAKLDMEAARKVLEKFRAQFGDRTFSDSAELIREDRDR